MSVKLDTLSKKEMEMIKTKFYDQKQQKQQQQKIYIWKHKVTFFILSSPHWPMTDSEL